MMYLDVKKTWRLNEKHYGMLQGLNKAEMAKQFSHLTAKQAAELAKEAGVKKLILTHISRRYRERDVLEEAQAIFPESVVARDFDGFQIKKDS